MALETFCMKVNIDKTKVVKFSLKKKTTQAQIRLKNELLEIVQNYKYLRLEFNERMNWDSCTRLQGR